MEGRSSMADFKLMGKLGTGTQGVVWKVVRKADGRTYALKEVEISGLRRKEQEACVAEVHLLATLDSPHIVKYFDAFVEQEKLYMVTEYASGGTLHGHMMKQGNQGLPEQIVWRLLIQMAVALQHLHTQKTIHRDVTSTNIFFDGNGDIKLGDLGVAKVLSSGTPSARTLIGTPYYFSPELCSGQPYDERSDIWALGVVLYECCTGRRPFDADNEGALVMCILHARVAPIDATYSDELRTVVQQCLRQSSHERPSAEELLRRRAVAGHARALHIPLPSPPG